MFYMIGSWGTHPGAGLPARRRLHERTDDDDAELRHLDAAANHERDQHECSVDGESTGDQQLITT